MRLPWHRVPAPIRYQTLTRWHGARSTLFGQTMEDRDAVALQMLAPLHGPYLPWTSYALRPEGIVTFLNAIALLDAARVVECGMGLSTVYGARLLAQRGRGHLHSIEEDPDWTESVLDRLRREGTDGYVTAHAAPLAPDGWYRRELLEPLGDEPVEVLLVDGPANRHRGVAVEFFADRLAKDYAVILDDVWLPSVEQALCRWERRLGVRGKRQYRQGGVGVLRPLGRRLEITY